MGLGHQLNHGPALGGRYHGGASNNVFRTDAATAPGTGRYKARNSWVVRAYSLGGSK